MKTNSQDASASIAPSTVVSELKALSFDAAITKKELEKFESEYNKTWGVKRRITFILLTSSHDELIQKFGKDDGPDTLLCMVEQITEYKEHLQVCLEMTEAAEARVLCALSTIVELPEDAEVKHG